jgi:CheY-like chemotaxis protein
MEGKMRILCIDDEALVLRMLKRHLTSRNCVVDLAQTPEIAMDLLAAYEYDLIVTDYDLGPKTVNGLRLTDFLKMFRNTPVILHTGTHENDLDLDNYRYKPDQIVKKGSVSDLLIAIENVMGKKEMSNEK